MRIVALLPNPDGPDPGHEWVELKNVSVESVNLGGWKLRDEAANDFALSGTVASGDVIRIELPAGKLPLNNGGDEIELLKPGSETEDFVSYSGEQVSSGVAIRFGD